MARALRPTAGDYFDARIVFVAGVGRRLIQRKGGKALVRLAAKGVGQV